MYENEKIPKLETWKSQKSDFSIQHAHAGAGKSAFSVFLRKSWKFAKKIKYIKNFFHHFSEKNYFLPEAEKSGNTQSEA